MFWRITECCCCYCLLVFVLLPWPRQSHSTKPLFGICLNANSLQKHFFQRQRLVLCILPYCCSKSYIYSLLDRSTLQAKMMPHLPGGKEVTKLLHTELSYKSKSHYVIFLNTSCCATTSPFFVWYFYCDEIWHEICSLWLWISDLFQCDDTVYFHSITNCSMTLCFYALLIFTNTFTVLLPFKVPQFFVICGYNSFGQHATVNNQKVVFCRELQNDVVTIR